MSNKIEFIQNISLFAISIFTFFPYFCHNYVQKLFGENDQQCNLIKSYDMLYPFVGLHACIDFFLTKSYDIKIHHLFIISIIFYNYYYNVSVEDRFVFIYSLLKT